MFDEQGNYLPPDQRSRHVLIVTQDHVATLRAGFPIPVSAGLVLAVGMLGQTNVSDAPHYGHPQAGATWIEHATANVGDVLPMDQVTLAVADAQKKQAAVAAFREKVAAELAQREAKTP